MHNCKLFVYIIIIFVGMGSIDNEYVVMLQALQNETITIDNER